MNPNDYAAQMSKFYKPVYQNQMSMLSNMSAVPQADKAEEKDGKPS
jgi:hypothetical protein